MAGLIKNQILKHLSKFTKNLSPDKINVSTLKGEGELSNLELDEAILTELLELPTWLRITKAECNRVGIKIQWTKLKSQPICLYLDKVVLETETCEDPRPPNSPTHQASYRSGGKYGFVDRVIDGIFVHINSVIVKMISKTFHASLELSRIKVHSVTPTWQSGHKDLRATRIRDPDRGQILLFKEVEWQTTRIEANGVELSCPDNMAATPLRLIANQAKIRITLKKRLSDCSIISSRVVLLLDDLLWVLTNTQLKAAIVYANSLSDVIQRSAKQGKQLAADTLQKEGLIDSQASIDQLRHQQLHQQQQPQQKIFSSPAARYFAKYDVVTSSFHIITCRVDLHLCDDTTSTGNKNAKKPWNIEGGAMQIALHRLSFDSYPYNIAGGERKHWYRYADNVGDRNAWVQQLLKQFREAVAHVQKARPMPSPTARGPPQRESQPPPGQGSPAAQSRNSPSHQGRSPQASPSHQGRSPQASPSHQGGATGAVRFTKMLESCYVVKLEDFVVYMVSTPDNKRTGHHKLVASDKKALHLPPDMSVFHLEFTEYFFPNGLQFPVPHPNLYVLVNPIRLTLDYLTLLWMNYFALNLSLDVKLDPNASEKEHVDTKVMVVMSRIILPSETKVEQPGDRPEAVQLQASRITVSNCHLEEQMKRSDLQSILDNYKKAALFQPPLAFPAECAPLKPLPPSLLAHGAGMDNPYLDRSIKEVLDALQPEELAKGPTLDTNSLKQAACQDVWCIVLDQVWLEFLGAGSRSRPVPFVEAFPLSLWISAKPIVANSKEKPSFNGHSKNSVTLGRDAPDENLSEEREKRPRRLLLKQYYSCDDDDDSSLSEASTNICDREGGDHAFLCVHGKRRGTGEGEIERSSGSVEICEVCQGLPPSGSQTADSHVLLQVGAKLRIQLTHHQYIFLLRLSESFSKFELQLVGDIKELGISNSTTACIPLVIPEVELAIVCPYQLNQPGFPEDFGSPLCLNTGKDAAETEVPSSSGKQTVGISDEPDIFGETVPDVDLQASKGNTQLPGGGNPHILFSKSLSDSTLQSLTLEGAMLTPQDHAPYAEGGLGRPGERGGLHRTTQSVSSLLSSADQDSLVTMNSNGGDSGLGMDSKSSSLKNMKGFKGTDVKKAFSSAFNNFTDKLNKLKPDEDSLSDDMDSLSIQTDLSDDDFEHINWDDGEDIPAFAHDPPSEASTDTYSDGGNDDNSSLYAESSTTKGKEMVSVVLFGLLNTELMVQATDAATMVAVQVSSLSTSQPGNVSYDEFYSKFSTAKGYIPSMDSIASSNGLYPVRLQSVTRPPPEGCEGEASLHSQLTVRAEDLSLQFEMSSLTALTEFVTDEKIAEVIPMDISLNNITLVLNDDVNKGSGSPASAPVALQLHKMVIQRGIDGVFHIRMEDGRDDLSSSGSVQTADSATSPTLALSPTGLVQSPDLLLAENVRLHKQVLELVKARRWFGEQLNEHKAQLKHMEALRLENSQLLGQVKKLQQWQMEAKGRLEVQAQRQAQAEEDSKGGGMAHLHQRLVELEEELSHAHQERDSLLATLRLVQEELLASERKNRDLAAARHS